jgi:hypothetical protein
MTRMLPGQVGLGPLVLISVFLPWLFYARRREALSGLAFEPLIGWNRAVRIRLRHGDDSSFSLHLENGRTVRGFN